MIDHSQISEHLDMYLNGHIDMESFEDWIVANTWDIHLVNDPKAASLAYALEESFAEYSSGHLTEAQLKVEFRLLLLEQEPVRVIEFVLDIHGEKSSPVMRSSWSGSELVIAQ
jgi:hypothetical protein